MLDEKEFRMMKDRVGVINLSRGGALNEVALIEAIDHGKVAFAGLDVFENEPKIHPELLGRDDVVLTPHVGASTVENFDYTAAKALENIDQIITQGKCLNRVN